MAGDLTPIPPFTTFGEKMANDLGAIGIRTWVRTIERAVCMAAWKEQKWPRILQALLKERQ